MTLVFVSSRELKFGIPVMDEHGNRLGESPNAAKQAIMQVVVSRIGMAVPAMGNVDIMSTVFSCGSETVFKTREIKHSSCWMHTGG